MRLVLKLDVSDAEREAIAWEVDLPSLREQFGHTEGGTSFRKPWRKRKAKRAEVVAYFESAIGVALEDLTSDYDGWRNHPTEAQAKR